jgi:ABC-type sugar transport system permease subunit
MSYEKSVSFYGNAKKAFEVARNTFLPLGFTIVENTDEYMELTGPKIPYTEGQNPLADFSRVSISAENNELTIEAELRDVRKSIKFLIGFFIIIGTAVFLAALFAVVFRNNPKFSPFYLLLVFAPWPVVLPMMGRLMKSRVSKSLDALLNNMTILGKE